MMQLADNDPKKTLISASSIQQTPPKLFYQALGQNSDHFDHVLSMAGIGFWHFDPIERKICGCSTFKSFLEMELHETIEIECVMRRVRKEDQSKLKRVFKSSLKGNETVMEIRLDSINSGELIWLKVTSKSYLDKSMPFIQFAGIVEDITGIKRREAAQMDMIVFFNHELRSPLTALGLYIQRARQLAGENQNELIKILLNKGIEQVNSMNAMANTFLDQSAIANGNLSLILHDFDLSEAINKLLEEFRFINPNFIFIFKSTSSIHLLADQQKILLVITNLINNAIKYSPLHSTITITCKKQSRAIRLEVKDQGAGIVDEQIKKLFSRFYRAADPETLKISGHGIGLYLVKKIIYAHGGTLSVTSKLQSGSVFSFMLPLNPLGFH